MGDSFTDIDNKGVVEFMFKIRKLVGEAQTLVNNSFATNSSENLSSFPAYSYSLPINELVEVTQVQTVLLPLGSINSTQSNSNQGLNNINVGNDLFGN